MSSRSGTPDRPLYERIEPVSPREVFDGAIAALQQVFQLDLRNERWDAFRRRADETYEQLLEVALIWDRIGDNRVRQIEAQRDTRSS
jgi:hypothetical protein